jgi:hypothetical protein
MSPTAADVHEAIKAAFLARGGTPEQWARVAADPRKFNRAWRRLLKLPEGEKPPALAMRRIDPRTGVIIGE